ncbi:CASP-like protein 1D1 isoform X2 [Salvia miltiorrhiza]|uniref:CASP-like protein 1D1 isoform X2 n=1 Tax=Salvia miltiorrhiza TaxID=226208 RepID=UPI0025ACFAD2|nr:CASP-like protein 1D1 isoform X2 [Salvia miltiorrhiza]
MGAKLKAFVAPPPPPPPPPLPPDSKGFSRSRYWVLVPLVLALNFSIGAYVLVKTTLRDKRISEEEIPEELTSSTSTSTT